eukprot:g8350.t1
MSFMNDESGSDEDDSDKEESTLESIEGNDEDSSSSEKEGSSVISAGCNDIEYTHKDADVLLNIHDQLDLDKLQKMKRFFIADDDTSGAYAELDMKQFSDALRSVLPDSEELTDEDLGLLFMKIDANGSGDIDWDEFTGFLLQLDEGNRNMAAAAQMSDLKPLPGTQRAGAGEHTGQHRDMIEKFNFSISAYVTCSRDGTIKFWHKGTFAHFRTIRHLDAMKAAYEIIIMGGKGREVEGNGRRVCSAPVNRAVKSMKSAWVYDIQQMPLSNRIAAACFDRTVSFYDMLTGEFVCRIGGLRSSPTCVDCVEIGANEQQVIFGDLDGVLHVWSFGKHFYIPGLQDTREPADLNGNYSLPMHSGAISCVGYVADLNATVTCGMDGKVHFFDLMKRRVTRTFGGHVERPIFAFAYSKRHRFVVSAGLGRVVVFWNSYTMHVLARRDGHGATVRHCLVDDRSDRVITISADKAVRCWDSATFRCIQSFKDHRMHRPDDTISAALWDHSRSSLVLAGNRLGVWKNKGAIQTSKHTHEAPVTAALYNSHFHQVVSGDAFGNVHVWLIETGLLAFRFGKAHGTSKISCMGFDASGRRLLTGANDGTVKMWNFNNGKELRLLQSGAGARGKGEKKNVGNERNEVSGLVWCRDGKGSENESLDIVATCSWDQQVRVFAMDPGHHTHFAAQQHQCGGQAANVTVPSRVFPGEDRPLQEQEGRHGASTRGKSARMGGGGSSWKDGGEGGSGGTTGPGKGHSADILAIAHCGHQQVATAGFDGQILIWATESGKAKFSMKPSDHEVSKVDELSSIGGLTSVARLMLKQRKKMGDNVDRDSVDSGGYLDRMEILLAEDASVSRISWDGREYFAEERIGGSDDGSGTGQAANVATDHELEDGSAAKGAETPAAEAAAETTTTGPKASAQEMSVISEEKTAAGDDSVDAEDTNGVRKSSSEPRKGGALSSPDTDTATAKSSTVPLTMLPTAATVEAGDGSPAGAPATGVGNGAVPPIPSGPRASAGSEASGMLLRGILRQPETAATASQSGNRKDTAPGDSSDKGDQKSRSGRGRQTPQGAGSESNAAEKGSRSARSKDDDVAKKANIQNKKDGVIEELLESTVSHAVDCLIYIRCHGVLCSGTASGELHFWDASSGEFIFGVAARHPNNPGLTAMSSNEGSLEGGDGGGVKPDTSEGLSGSVDASRGGSPATTAVGGGAPAVASGSADLMLYTACEEGFVKTWRVGDITEHAYQTGLRTRPKPPRKVGGGRAGKGSSGEAAAPSASPFADNQAMPQISLLQPMHQWLAHKTAVTYVDGGNFRGKLDLLITAGDDCYVHVWTVGGAHVGTFGQPTAWSLGSRATWREPTDQALCSTYGQNRAGEGDEQSSSITSSTAATTTTTGEQESKATSQGGSKRLRRNATKLGKATSTTASEGENELQQTSRKPENSQARISQDRDLEKERQEAERYQEKRYYIASQNRVQRKLLRGRLSAFCVSRDYYKKEKIQEASQILSETVKKASVHPQLSSMRNGLSRNRITSILRNTYNQVSFQLQLHKHEDVHERAEVTLTRRKSSRRAKAGSNAASNQPHTRQGGTNYSSSRTVTAGVATPRTVSRATAAEDVAGGSMKPIEDAAVPRGDSQEGGGARGGSRGGGGGVFAGSAESSSKDHKGGVRPAVPADPPSSSAAGARHFRRASTAGG